MGTAPPRVERASEGLSWNALDGSDRVGAVRALSRPDERRFVYFDSCRADAYAPLLAAVAHELPRDLYVTIDEADGERRGVYENLGFAVERRESHYLIPADPDVTGLAGAEPPTGLSLVSADEADPDRLRRLDDVLRQDVPGTDGWKWDESGFQEELGQPAFDPATYLVAVEDATGAYVGIARVWINPDRPRLGFVGVLPAYRRRGLARALLGRVFAVLYERGVSDVTTEIDDENVPSRSLLEPLGARRTGGSLELIRRSG